MKYGHEHSFNTIVLTENMDSEITKHADGAIHLLCGKELTPPETRGYTVTLLQLYLMAIYAANAIKSITVTDFDELLSDAEKLIDNYDDFVKQSELWFDLNCGSIVSSERIYILGYGIDFATAIEAQLKIGEMLRIAALGYEIEEYSHGPTMALKSNQSIIMIGSDEAEWDRMLLFRKAFLKYTPRVFTISYKEFDANEKDLLFTNKTNKYLGPLVFTLPNQFVAAKGALKIDIDTGVNPFTEHLAHL